MKDNKTFRTPENNEIFVSKLIKNIDKCYKGMKYSNKTLSFSEFNKLNDSFNKSIMALKKMIKDNPEYKISDEMFNKTINKYITTFKIKLKPEQYKFSDILDILEKFKYGTYGNAKVQNKDIKTTNNVSKDTFNK